MTIVKNVFATNVVIEHCPYPEMYARDNIVGKLVEYVDQFSKWIVPEQRGKAKSSVGRGEIAHLQYLQTLMQWIKQTVWKNRHYFENGKEAQAMELGRNWINEMYEGCSGVEHQHDVPVAVFYVRNPPGGADLIFVNGSEKIAAGAKEGDLLIHEPGIVHSVSEHISSVTRICLVIEFKFV